MKLTALTLPFLLVLGLCCADVLLGCEGDCPDNFLSICVESDGDCRCGCAKNVDEGSAALAEFLHEAGVSPEGTEEGVKRYRRLVEADRGAKFTFELEEQGRVLFVHGVGAGSVEDIAVVE